MEQEQAATRDSADTIPTGPVEGGPTAQSTPESAGDLRGALASKTQEVERLQERLLRLQAEFENYKKRMAREKSEFIKFAHEGLILDFLPVLDNLERAVGAARAEMGTTPVLEGLEMIGRLFRSVLEKAGVKTMDTTGKPFDPGYHQAVAQVETSHGDSNVVVEEIQKGYLIEGRVLRPAMVKVSRAVSPDPGDGPGGKGAQA